MVRTLVANKVSMRVADGRAGCMLILFATSVHVARRMHITLAECAMRRLGPVGADVTGPDGSAGGPEHPDLRWAVRVACERGGRDGGRGGAAAQTRRGHQRQGSLRRDAAQRWCAIHLRLSVTGSRRVCGLQFAVWGWSGVCRLRLGGLAGRDVTVWLFGIWGLEERVWFGGVRVRGEGGEWDVQDLRLSDLGLVGDL
eukprot:1710990-Rhodomonas_salina.1